MAARRPSPRTPPPRRTPPAGPPESERRLRRRLWLCAGALVILGTLAYANSLDGVFVLDDLDGIVENPDIRRVWSAESLRSSSGESSVLGRPLVTASFAINYALHGLNVRGYHIGNIAVHILCALVLLGLIHRVSRSLTLAFAAASLWLVHPLHTDVVDYLSQRTESMMGLFYLLTIYASVRAHSAPRPTPWLALAVVSGILGMASKQSMVTMPAAVVLVDRVLFFASLRDAFRSRWRFYAILAAACWLVLVTTVLVSPPSRSVGFSTPVDEWVYLLNQSVIITRYLWLTVWPQDLVMDYGYSRPFALADVWPQMLFVTALCGLTIVALRYRPRLGLLGAWFFITLSSTSSFVPIATEVGAERRMYLPLAALVILAVSACMWLAERIVRTWPERRKAVAVAGPIVWAAIVAVLVAGTVSRNEDYSSALRLAQTSLDRWPTGRARHIVAGALLDAGRRDEALPLLREAIRDDPRAHFTLGFELFRDGDYGAAREHLEQFLRLEPLLVQAVDATILLGRALAAEGQLEAAAARFEQALSMRSSSLNAHLGLSDVRLAQQRFGEAIVHYRAYLDGGGESDGAWTNLGIALAATGEREQGIRAIRRAIELNPQAAEAHRTLGVLLLDEGRAGEAAQHASRAVALRPADARARDLLGLALSAERRFDEAIEQFQEALRLDPSDPYAQEHLARARGARGARR